MAFSFMSDISESDLASSGSILVSLQIPFSCIRLYPFDRTLESDSAEDVVYEMFVFYLLYVLVDEKLYLPVDFLFVFFDALHLFFVSVSTRRSMSLVSVSNPVEADPKRTIVGLR